MKKDLCAKSHAWLSWKLADGRVATQQAQRPKRPRRHQIIEVLDIIISNRHLTPETPLSGLWDSEFHNHGTANFTAQSDTWRRQRLPLSQQQRTYQQ
jgi:hypothetical protein